MSLIDQIINLVITLDTRAPSQAGFGTPLILCYHEAWADRVREYSSPDEMLDDGFTTDDQAYKDAQIIVSQSPHPSTFKVGRRDTPLTQKIDITPTVTKAGFVYTGSIAGQTWTVTVQAEDLVADICDDIVTAVNALSNDVVTATDGTSKVTLTADDAGAVHAFTFGPGLDVMDVTTDSTTDDELAAIVAADSDWYGLTIADSQSKDTIVLGAAWAETQKKIFLAQTADANCLSSGSSTDTMAALKAASYKNTATIWHRHIGGTERLATGWLSTILVP
ncbi:MAG TPA: DUF3383 family protein, partial [Labilithrix sp.]|nr:DUF3383 family protein [Labilithrix sp.]